MRRLLVAFALAGCSSDALAPSAVASPWARRSLDHEPDVVVAVDLARMRGDPFFGALARWAREDAPLGLDAALDARRVDFFGTVTKAFAAVVYGAAPSAEASRCLTRHGDLELSVGAGRWVMSSAHAGGEAPGPVDMDGRAVAEAWVGPGALDLALARASFDAREMWRHLYALRLRVDGGASPGFVLDARFETSVDAEHAEYDLARVRRLIERSAGDLREDEIGKLLLGELANVRVARADHDLEVGYRMTPSFARYVLGRIDEARPPRRAQRSCD